MQILERRFEALRRVGGYNSASALLSNAAFLLGLEKEFKRAGSFHEQLSLVIDEFRIDAGHRVTNFLRHRGTLPPLQYRSVLRRAAMELGIGVLARETLESLEVRVVSKMLGTSWDPSSPAQRKLLALELTRILREKHKEFGAPLKRILGTALSLRGITKGKPKWTEQRTALGIAATGLYAAIKLGEPDFWPRVFPCILVFALVRSELEVAAARGASEQVTIEHRAR